MRNSYLISRAMLHYIFASILNKLTSQLSIIVDGIFVGNMVDPDALSATSMYIPISSAITAFATLLGFGACIAASRAMGRGDQEKANGLLSTALSVELIVALTLFPIGVLFSKTLCSIICTETEVLPYFEDYTLVMLSTAGISMLFAFVNQCVCIDGRPIVATKSLVGTCITNLVFDYLLVGLAGLGITGSAIATIISLVVGITISCRYLFGNECKINFTPALTTVRRFFFTNIKLGLPQMTSILATTVMLLAFNIAAQRSAGAQGLYVAALSNNVVSFLLMLSNGLGTTIYGIGSFLYGQGDSKGLNILVNRVYIGIAIITTAVTLMVVIFPSVLCELFGADTDELTAYASKNIRIVTFAAPLLCLYFTLAKMYQAVGKLALTSLLSMLYPIILILLFLFFCQLDDPEMLWYAVPVCYSILPLFAVVTSEVVRRRSKEPLTFLTLVPKSYDTMLFSTSVGMNMKAVANAVDSFRAEISKYVADNELLNKVCHCTEETMLNIVQHSGRHTGYFDVMLSLRGNELKVSIKDDGKEFNPLGMIGPEHQSAHKGFGLTIIEAMYQNYDYKYMYGQNMTFMTWKMTN